MPRNTATTGASAAWLSVAALLLACGGPAAEPTAGVQRELILDERPRDIAVLGLGDLGEIRFELLSEVAPQTVENFEKLGAQGFYDGTRFHRVIPDFMIQGGDPNSRDKDPRNDGQGGPGYAIADEFSSLSHHRGTVSMANHGQPNSAGSQFFIVHADAPHLDGQYTIFGRVTQGMEVVDAITELEIDTYGRWGPRNRPYPVEAIVESLRIEPAAKEVASVGGAGGP